ncbi:hypothetical protein MRX96_018730 [Rhipicephalus microplus]
MDLVGIFLPGFCNFVRESMEMRRLLDRVGLLPPGERPGAGPDGELEEQTPLSDETTRKIIVYPLPKNMDTERDAGRRAARTAALARQHQRDEGAVNVDAARYPGRCNAFAAVEVSATTGKLLTASTVRVRTAGQAEEAAIALATISTDIKPNQFSFRFE